MKKNILVLIAYIIMVTVNAMAIIIPLGGHTTQEISDMYSNLFTPANITFSIWSVIYILLFIGIVQQIIRERNKDINVLPDNIKLLLVTNFILNALWMLSWQYQYILVSVVIMLLIITTLILISIKIYKMNYGVINYAISIYLGWISVALIANISALLVSIQWSGFGIDPVIWTVLVILVAAFLGMYAIYKKSDILYSLVIVWAFIGIAIKQSDGNQVIFFTTIIFAIIITIYAIFKFINLRNQD